MGGGAGWWVYVLVCGVLYVCCVWDLYVCVSLATPPPPPPMLSILPTPHLIELTQTPQHLVTQYTTTTPQLH